MPLKALGLPNLAVSGGVCPSIPWGLHVLMVLESQATQKHPGGSLCESAREFLKSDEERGTPNLSALAK